MAEQKVHSWKSFSRSEKIIHSKLSMSMNDNGLDREQNSKIKSTKNELQPLGKNYLLSYLIYPAVFSKVSFSTSKLTH
jgi:hypothetical protein